MGTRCGNVLSLHQDFKRVLSGDQSSSLFEVDWPCWCVLCPSSDTPQLAWDSKTTVWWVSILHLVPPWQWHLERKLVMLTPPQPSPAGRHPTPKQATPPITPPSCAAGSGKKNPWLSTRTSPVLMESEAEDTVFSTHFLEATGLNGVCV